MLTIDVSCKRTSAVSPASILSIPGVNAEHAWLQGPLPEVVHLLGPVLDSLPGGDGHLKLLEESWRIVVGPAKLAPAVDPGLLTVKVSSGLGQTSGSVSLQVNLLGKLHQGPGDPGLLIRSVGVHFTQHPGQLLRVVVLRHVVVLENTVSSSENPLVIDEGPPAAVTHRLHVV